MAATPPRLAQHANLSLERFDDVSDLEVFENASVYPVILIIGNSKTANAEVAWHRGTFNPLQKTEKRKISYRDETWLSDLTAEHQGFKYESVQLGEVCKPMGAATVSEAYEIHEAITDKKPSSALKFIVSGNILNFGTTWGSQKTKYLKKSFEAPYVNLKSSAVPEKRKAQYRQTKIIIPNMTKGLRAFLDDGEYAAAKSTTIIMESNLSAHFAHVDRGFQSHAGT